MEGASAAGGAGADRRPWLPADHPERAVLADEVHARPYEALETPVRATYLAVLLDAAERSRERQHLMDLFERYAHPPPPESASHFSVAMGPFRLKWERHGEFSTYAIFVPGRSAQPFGAPAITALPADWLAAIPGRTIAAAHAKLVSAEGESLEAAALARYFDGNTVIGGEIGEGAGLAFTDFRTGSDGCVRFLVLDRSFTRRQAGRMLQRLFEIETYRMMALLALPVARSEGPRVRECEDALARLAGAIAREDRGDEPLLAELTRLAAQVESTIAASQFRFGASRAYYDLVRARIQELRERRLPGLQTIEEFMGRRLAPAIATCESIARRLANLSERIARTSNLLSTRVGIARERQNQALLESMDRRARLQLRLQETVEGLSIAAITYYVASLVGYGAKALKAGGVQLDSDVVMGLAIPVVAVLAALGVRYVRRQIVTEHN
jgi:uncharacterized membrane-anchored protein